MSKTRAVLLALFVTVIWSMSWVLVKIGLGNIPPLTFAGLRYSLAFACLLPFALRKPHRDQIQHLSGKNWGVMIILGVLFYAVTQGAQFVGLDLLPAASVSLLLNFSSILVALAGIFTLRELPSPIQWLGIAINLAGVLLYFYPIAFSPQQALGIAVVGLGVTANAASSIIGRQVNRSQMAHPLVITTISMGIGGILLLISGLVTQPAPHLGLQEWAIIVFLAVVNTAFAFTLWNISLQTLSAMESSVINNTMLVQIALLAWIFLGESLNTKEILGLVLAGVGVLIVQVPPTLLLSKMVRKAEKEPGQL